MSADECLDALRQLRSAGAGAEPALLSALGAACEGEGAEAAVRSAVAEEALLYADGRWLRPADCVWEDLPAIAAPVRRPSLARALPEALRDFAVRALGVEPVDPQEVLARLRRLTAEVARLGVAAVSCAARPPRRCTHRLQRSGALGRAARPIRPSAPPIARWRAACPPRPRGLAHSGARVHVTVAPARVRLGMVLRQSGPGA